MSQPADLGSLDRLNKGDRISYQALSREQTNNLVVINEMKIGSATVAEYECLIIHLNLSDYRCTEF